MINNLLGIGLGTYLIGAVSDALLSSFGDDCVACGLAEEAIKRGGHVQVGLEPYVGPRTPTNVELVEEVVALAKKYDRPLATPAEAAEMLDLPTYPAGYGAGS